MSVSEVIRITQEYTKTRNNRGEPVFLLKGVFHRSLIKNQVCVFVPAILEHKATKLRVGDYAMVVGTINIKSIINDDDAPDYAMFVHCFHLIEIPRFCPKCYNKSIKEISDKEPSE